MPPGKLAAQAGHAYSAALLEAIRTGAADPEALVEAPVVRIALSAPDLAALLRARDAARAAGLPCALFTDSGHVLPPHFDGSPVVTALGVGPCRRSAARPAVRRFRCL